MESEVLNIVFLGYAPSFDNMLDRLLLSYISFSLTPMGLDYPVFAHGFMLRCPGEVKPLLDIG